MFDEQDMMSEVMVDAFLHLEEENLENKTIREVLMAWVTWVESRYKVAYVPNICYAIIDCEDGNLISMFNAEEPTAKQQANDMCASLNGFKKDDDEDLPIKDNDKKVDVTEVIDAFLNMDERSFMDFLLDHAAQERGE